MKIPSFLRMLPGFLAFFSSGCLSAQKANFNVIPLPREVRTMPQLGTFHLNPSTAIVCGKNTKDRRNARFLREYILQRTGLHLSLKAQGTGRNEIVVKTGLSETNPEAYRLTVDSAEIVIEGASPAGTFYGIQTLRKALPALNTVSLSTGKTANIDLPGIVVLDAPRFAYRGAHLDVARHFITTDSIRRYIDLLALHNINRFHWHLTDDQGWRIEIKRYPKLTTIGSRRSETVIGHNSGRYDGRPYGGFYTQRECRKLVRYAAERHITIIPEIDMPGHMMGALAAYPELGCTGGPYEVWKMWGVSEEVLCAGNPKTYDFIDNVLDEITKIFPSRYIHVGGDECPKTRWQQCPKCQAFIKTKGLQTEGKHTAEERLQSYFIRHAEQHLGKLGRKIIGWDETLEGGLAPGATVMSWRGEAGGIEAAKSGHDAIMAPNSYLYFDYYQAQNTSEEPEAIGGYLPLDRVYSYEPIADGTPADIAHHFIGLQANIWTEYIPTFRQVEYMALPRMAALSEIQWCPRGTRSYARFLQRLPALFSLYRENNYNFARHFYDVDIQSHVVADSGIVVQLSTNGQAQIRYTLDGTTPTTTSKLYIHPILLKEDTRLSAAAFRNMSAANGKTMEEKSHIAREDFHFSKSTTHPVLLLQGCNPQYRFSGAELLTNGLRAKDTNHNSGQWIGFNGQDMEAIIDLGQSESVEQVIFHTCIEKGSWIYDARNIDIAVSNDGEHWDTVYQKELPALTEASPNQINEHRCTFTPRQARFVKVKATPEHSIPSWHTGAAGKPAFLFVDELEVN